MWHLLYRHKCSDRLWNMSDIFLSCRRTCMLYLRGSYRADLILYEWSYHITLSSFSAEGLLALPSNIWWRNTTLYRSVRSKNLTYDSWPTHVLIHSSTEGFWMKTRNLFTKVLLSRTHWSGDSSKMTQIQLKCIFNEMSPDMIELQQRLSCPLVAASDSLHSMNDVVQSGSRPSAGPSEGPDEPNAASTMKSHPWLTCRPNRTISGFI